MFEKQLDEIQRKCRNFTHLSSQFFEATHLFTTFESQWLKELNTATKKIMTEVIQWTRQLQIPLIGITYI